MPSKLLRTLQCNTLRLTTQYALVKLASSAVCSLTEQLVPASFRNLEAAYLHQYNVTGASTARH